jgi:hypothetical protein
MYVCMHVCKAYVCMHSLHYKGSLNYLCCEHVYAHTYIHTHAYTQEERIIKYI